MRESEDDEEDREIGGVHMMATAMGRPGPAYWWGFIGPPKTFTRVMIDSGNTVGALVSEEFAEELGLVGETFTGEIEVPTAAAANMLQVVWQCNRLQIQLARVEGEFQIHPLVVSRLTHPVNLGHHFLGQYWGSLDFLWRCDDSLRISDGSLGEMR